MANETGAARQTIVGLFVTGGIALSVLAFIFFGNTNFFSRNTQAVIVFQDSVAGLSVGAPVTFRGVRVGSVDKITLRYDQSTGTPYIPVEITLDPAQVHVIRDPKSSDHINLREVIDRGLRAEQNVQSFVTGTVSINLDFFPGSPAVLHPQVTSLREIPTHASAIQKMKETLSDLPLKELVSNVNDAVLSIREVAQKLNVQFPALVDSLQESSRDAQQTLKAATATVKDMQGKLNVTLLDIDRVMQTGNAQLQSRGADLHATLTSATKTADEARKTLENVESIISPRSANRDNLDSALRDIATAAAALRGFASDVERNPQLLLMGRRQ
ncbi:MAG: MlaD family protein [Acetobacter aceti]|uniref:Paraquat-inducible protein B n=1 Tax=Acetobacter aceti TaxID=435 RepID=A0A1U9KG10_ACEAC|nr:MlaD family protein [Acetobacter aceti]AQS84743.1 paraquat-inducible protein B [Acetobacter aceti]